ncbi:ROK family protein [Solirubrobacter sp. CPCC 204708]|uniref:ROK family protein n=1 Tax=Solirubrobacter deserti TaxID=2282478 RepID=A0ABT4RUF7_9ACTN|nr:ROK family protein [Solirubrobacter deserti]MBE2320171.1 ROK family protein [Solirubrobacter deserti]MDA0142218.1 ROK family protein [Solirubrobacter deserti]
MERTSRRDARARVVGVLAEAGAVSRADLARRAALAPSTVSAVVSDLQAAGLVVEPAAPVHPPERGTVGRPPVLIALHRKAGVVAGVDFGKRHLRMAISDLSHQLLAERHRALDADLPAREAIVLAQRMFKEALEAAEVSKSELLGIGMGLPGPVHRPSGELGNSTILPGWVGINAANAVSEALGHHVEVENDANLGALGEWVWGSGRGVEHMAYVKAATGIGAGFIVAGQPYVGAGGTAGELGHTVVDPGGPICRCGNRGCLETFAGGPAVLAALADLHGDELTLQDVVRLAQRGDTGVARAIADAGAAIGTAVATLCNLFNPQKVVVGGDLGAAGDLLLDPLRESLRRGAIRSAAEDVVVLQGELGERAEVLGAVALVLGRVVA